MKSLLDTDDERILSLESRVEALERKLASADTNQLVNGGKSKSLKEFLIEHKPATANDQGLCIGYFLENNKGYESFSTEDIKKGFREARIPLPKNPSDVIGKNVGKGFMMEASRNKDGKKAWVLTVSGERHTTRGFGKSV